MCKHGTKTTLVRGFIQALLLISIFHEGLSFMTIGHNTMSVSMLVIATGGGVIWGAVSPPLCIAP